MAALNKCLLEHKPSPYLAGRLRLLSDAYKGDPLASTKAAEDMLAELQAERADLVKQIEAKGGKLPKPAENEQQGGNVDSARVPRPGMGEGVLRAGDERRDGRDRVTSTETQRALFDDGSGPTGGPPSPKVLAAKQAAFLEKARSGDAAFLKTLASSTDPKGLQRALIHIIDKKGEGFDKTREAITARMRELIQIPGVALGMQGKKYSLMGAGARDGLHVAEQGRGFALHDDLSGEWIETGHPLQDEISGEFRTRADAEQALRDYNTGKKYNMESAVLHAALGRAGFGAVHNSPHKFDGRFDWRKFAGSGEGAMLKGAGTYLSTADGVHLYYKKLFSVNASDDKSVHSMPFIDKFKDADLRKKLYGFVDTLVTVGVRTPSEIQESLVGMYDKTLSPKEMADAGLTRKDMADMKRVAELAAKAPDSAFDFKIGDVISPTYSVSVDIAPERLLDWDKPLSEQSASVRLRALKAIKDNDLFREELDMETGTASKAQMTLKVRGEDFYRELSNKLGSSRDVGDPLASDYLQSIGIFGHRMRASIKHGDMNPNYVIYDDSKITTNYVHFDQTKADPNAMGPQDRASVEAFLKRVDPDVKVQWVNILHAGEFEETATGRVVRLSVHSLNPTSVAYHEALHDLFAMLRKDGHGDIMAVLEKAGESAPVLNQLKKLLANEPAALRQLSDPEERAAYMYQFWNMRDGSGNRMLNLGPKAENVFQRIAAFIRKITGMWTNDERAELIMNYFHSGDYAANRSDINAVRRATMDTGLGPALAKAKAMTEPLRELGNTLAVAGGARLRDSGIPALRELADIMKLKTTSEGTDPGYVPAARAEHSRFMNELAAALKPYTKEVLSEALEILQTGAKPVATPANLAARTVAKIVSTRLAERLQYMKDATVRIDAIGLKDGVPYFPRSYDSSYISSHQRQFLAMLDRNGVTDSMAVMKKIMVTDGAEFTVEVDKPGMQPAKIRKLAFIPHAEVAPFMRKDLFQIMNSYSQQASRRAEWARRLGDDGSGVTMLLAKAEAQGATPAQLDAGRQFVRAVDGTLGDTLNPTARRLFGDLLVYQNIRLLPLAIFSSIVDPMGVVVRGGTVGEAFMAFKRGIRETVKNFQKEGGTSDDMTHLAEAIGTVDNVALIHTIGSSHTQGMVGDRVRGWNDTFFRWNLMDQWNRSMRVAATEVAMSFLVRHSTKPTTHSARYLRELGLTAADVVVDPLTGRPKIFEHEGLTLEQSAKMKAAINRWVDGAVLRPDAVDKAIWMNDPHFALVAHLKQFVFSFHETILKRVAHEAKNGNYAPAMALTSYVPIMIAADTVKGLIQGGGEEPPWKAGWTAGDYAWSGMERSGLFGVGQFGIDVASDITNRGGSGFGALSGPTIQQLTDAVSVIGGNKQFDRFLLKSLPANAVYGSAFDGGGGGGGGEPVPEPVSGLK